MLKLSLLLQQSRNYPSQLRDQGNLIISTTQKSHTFGWIRNSMLVRYQGWKNMGRSIKVVNGFILCGRNGRVFIISDKGPWRGMSIVKFEKSLYWWNVAGMYHVITCWVVVQISSRWNLRIWWICSSNKDR
jgi:hypothetical protein